MLSAAGKWARDWAHATYPWTNVYGVARSLLALASALTLVFSPMSTLFFPVYGADPASRCQGVARVTAFCLAPSPSHEIVRALMVVALLVIASGWRPRWTAPLHAFIAFSLANNLSILDGGDQVALDLSLLLLPIALTDRRRWHWDPPAPVDLPARGSFLEDARRLAATFAWTLVRVQVAAIYFHAAIGKFGVEDWVDGTAVYYFSTNSLYGASSAVLLVMRPIVESAIGVTVLTWGTLVLEYLLSAALFMPKRYWRPLLVLGLSLHAGIIVVHGLLSFAITMFGALVLFLRPREASFNFAWLRMLGRCNRCVRRRTPRGGRGGAGWAVWKGVVQPGALCSFAGSGGGTVTGPRGSFISSARRRARVAAQYFGAR